MYNGRGLGRKETTVGQRSLTGFGRSLKVFEGLQRCIKGFEEVSKGVGDFEGTFEGLEGVSHDRKVGTTKSKPAAVELV